MLEELRDPVALCAPDQSSEAPEEGGEDVDVLLTDFSNRFHSVEQFERGGDETLFGIAAPLLRPGKRQAPKPEHSRSYAAEPCENDCAGSQELDHG
jgi:hypothetical protein